MSALHFLYHSSNTDFPCDIVLVKLYRTGTGCSRKVMLFQNLLRHPLPGFEMVCKRCVKSTATGCPLFTRNILKDLSILQYDVIFLSPDFLRKLRGFSKSFAYVGSVAKGNKG